MKNILSVILKIKKAFYSCFPKLLKQNDPFGFIPKGIPCYPKRVKRRLFIGGVVVFLGSWFMPKAWMLKAPESSKKPSKSRHRHHKMNGTRLPAYDGYLEYQDGEWTWYHNA